MDGLPINALAARAPSFLPTHLANHTKGARLNTSHIVIEALRSFYPSLHLTITPTSSTDLLGFAKEGHATCTSINPETTIQKTFVNGAIRSSLPSQLRPSPTSKAPSGKPLPEDEPHILHDLSYGKFLYNWQDHEFLVFIVDCESRNGNCAEKTNFILAAKPEGWTAKDEGAYESEATHGLMLKVAEWMMDAKEHVLVFDEGRWKKNQKLWEVAQHASWDDVVLDEGMKSGLRADVEGFFGSREFYGRLRVPWKRGIILHGSPGNGKTLAIQAIMRGLYSLTPSVPTLYVKSFSAESGAQWAIRQIFTKARKTAPCLIVFEDIDSMITDKLRSYFLNEVDGLESNDGIFMLGTTNHLEQLDPALAQRPSRFDRKIFFDRPNLAERTMYAQFWRGNVPGGNEKNFSNELCAAVADVTDGFSFAYLKELFLATLLGMAREGVSLEAGDEQDGAAAAAKEEAALEEDEVLVSKPGSSGASEKDEAEKNDEDEEKLQKEKVKEKTYPTLAKSVLWPRIKAQADILRTAIVSEAATGKSYAAMGEKGLFRDDEDDAMDARMVRNRQAQQMRMMRAMPM